MDHLAAGPAEALADAARRAQRRRLRSHRGHLRGRGSPDFGPTMPLKGGYSPDFTRNLDFT